MLAGVEGTSLTSLLQSRQVYLGGNPVLWYMALASVPLALLLWFVEELAIRRHVRWVRKSQHGRYRSL